MPYQDYKHLHLTSSIIGCAMKVHSYLGPGFPEIIYHRSLIVELEKAKLNYVSEYARDVRYEGVWVGLRRLDLLVEGVVLLELKATTEIKNVDYNQVLNLLKIFEIEVGILLNFGKASLEFKRFAHTINPINLRNPRNP